MFYFIYILLLVHATFWRDFWNTGSLTYILSRFAWQMLFIPDGFYILFGTIFEYVTTFDLYADSTIITIIGGCERGWYRRNSKPNLNQKSNMIPIVFSWFCNSVTGLEIGLVLLSLLTLWCSWTVPSKLIIKIIYQRSRMGDAPSCLRHWIKKNQDGARPCSKIK